MDLKGFDGKCVLITTVSGEAYEGIVSYLSEEYVFHEYGCKQEALYLTPILFYKCDISNILSLEDVNGPFGHYSDKYGLLETECLEWGTDMIGEVFDSDDDTQKLRMLACINENFRSLAERAVPGMAPWRCRNGMLSSEDEENGTGPVYLGELENMLNTLVKYNRNEDVVKEANNALIQLAEFFPGGQESFAEQSR